jgi:hypothetical protein
VKKKKYAKDISNCGREPRENYMQRSTPVPSELPEKEPEERGKERMEDEWSRNV